MSAFFGGQLFRPVPPSYEITDNALPPGVEIVDVQSDADDGFAAFNSDDTPPPSKALDNTVKTIAIPSKSHTEANTETTSAEPKTSKQVLSHFHGKAKFPIHRFPYLSAPMSPHILVKSFDDTYTPCRQMHGDLAELQERHPGQIAITVLNCHSSVGATRMLGRQRWARTMSTHMGAL